MDVPLRYDITKVLKTVERVVPTRFGSIDSVHQAGNDTHRHYAYEAERGPFVVTADDSVFHLTATLTYKARGFFKPPIGPTVSVSCGTSGENPPRILIELATPLSLSPRWRLTSHTSIVRIEPASDSARDRCRVGLMHRDVTDQVIDAARRGLDEQAREHRQHDRPRRSHRACATLVAPARAADPICPTACGSRSAPSVCAWATSTATDARCSVRVGLDARPRIVAGVASLDTAADTVPPLARDTVANGFHILMEGLVDFRTLSRALNAALRGKSVTEQGHTLVVDSLRVTPRLGGRLALTVLFHGDANGLLRLVGTPRHDAAQGVITIPDLDYDLETDSPLINAYSWLKSDGLRALLRERAIASDGPAIDRGRALLLAGLNRKVGDAMTLRATVDSVAVRGLYVQAEES